jgi:spermidine/putrescine-binding protein
MTKVAILAAAAACLAMPAHAEGKLNIFNFGLYTPRNCWKNSRRSTGSR